MIAKRKNLVYALLIGTFLCSCQSGEEKIVYHPNGRTEMLYRIKNGQLDGTSKSYYPNGAARSVSSWKEGRKDGLSTQYYEDGKLKSTSWWKNGLAEGLAKNYYSNDVLKDQTIWKNSKVFGKSYEYYSSGKVKKTALISPNTNNRTVIIYDSSGLPQEKHIEKSDGNLVYVSSFDRQGREKPGIVVPLYENETDTVPLGGTYRSKMRFGLNMHRKTQIVVSAAGKSYRSADTLSFIPDQQGQAFHITRPALRVGENRFYFKFVCQDCPDDTLSISTLSSSHSFFVKR